MKQLTLFTLLIFTPTLNAADPPPRKGLHVHEWGVFRVNSDVDFANADLRAEWDNLPPFIYGFIKGRVVPQHWGAFEPRFRPIIFFHASEPTQVAVKIDFPGGMPGVWYPATVRPAVEASQKQPKIGSSLEWHLAIKQHPMNWLPKERTPPTVEGNHWIARVRRVQADEIFARFSPNFADVERERFLFYDGLFPQGKWMKIAVEKDRVSLTSQVRHPVYDVTLVDRRDGKVRVGRVPQLNGGESIKEVEFSDVRADSFVEDASNTLATQLVKAGLDEAEALSLVDLWRKDMFETPGLCLFYRLPQSEYDVRMPLTISPKPANTVRVGLVYHGHLEPDFAERIDNLVKQFDSPLFVIREAAMKQIIQIGPAALVQIQRIRERKELSAEVRQRIDLLVKKWNARDSFDK